MKHIRPAAVAGTFYPGDPAILKRDVDALLASVQPRHTEQAPNGQVRFPLPNPPPKGEVDAGSLRESYIKAIIVPHAGYIYSGPIAASAYARLTPFRAQYRRVVLLGPVHRVPVRGLALPGDVDSFATPLGTVPLDMPAMMQIADLPQVCHNAPAHAWEHSLEVHLPFLQEVLGDFTLVPLAVGDATPGEVAGVLEALWGGPETLIVISSDLSHYLPYETAEKIDRATANMILALTPPLSHEQACGGTPVNGLLLAAKARRLKPECLDLRNSGDTAGDRSRVVGYGAFAFYEGADMSTDPQGMTLLAMARAAISDALGKTASLSPNSLPEGKRDADSLREVQVIDSARWLDEPGACFVTLTIAGQLRGCIGSLEAHRSLRDDIKANAQAAAFNDPRFPPLDADELDRIRVEVSLLSPQQAMHFSSEADALDQLRPLEDGIVFEYGHHRSTFLPQVWEQLPEPTEFMAHLKAKAGLSPGFWAEGVKLSRYRVEKWKE